MRKLDQALYNRLNGQTSLTTLGVTGVYKSVAPEGTATPYVIFNQLPGTDDWTFGGRATTDYVYFIKGVVEGYDGEEKAQAIAEAIDALVEAATLTVTGHNLLLLRRQSDVSYPEQAGNQVFYHAGGNYRVEVA